MPFVPDSAPVGRFVPDEPPKAPGMAAAGVTPPARASLAPRANRGEMAGEALTGLADLAGAALSYLPLKAAAGVAGIATGGDADVVRSIEGAYQPGESARKIVAPIAEAVAPIVEPVKGVIEAGLSKTGPLENILRTGGSALAEAAADLLPAGAISIPARAASRAAAVTRKAAEIARPAINPEIARLRSVGYKFRPSDVEAGSPGAKVSGKVAEALEDQPDLRRNLTRDNQQISTREAGADIGKRDATLIDDADLNKAKAPHFRVYNAAEKAAAQVPPSAELDTLLAQGREIAKFRRGATPGVTRTIGALRRQSAKDIKANDVATRNAGFAARDLADQIEEEFGKRLKEANNPQLLKQYQDSRQALAKVHDVETAVHAGQVDAHVLQRMRQKGVKLSGPLLSIAKAAEHAPNVTRHSTKTAGASQIKTVAEGVRKVVGGTARKLGGARMDVRSPKFQERFGRESVEPQQIKPVAEPVVQPMPEQFEFLGSGMDLALPEGQASRFARPMPEAQSPLDLPGGMILEPPPGQIGLSPSILEFLRALEARYRQTRPPK